MVMFVVIDVSVGKYLSVTIAVSFSDHAVYMDAGAVKFSVAFPSVQFAAAAVIAHIVALTVSFSTGVVKLKLVTREVDATVVVVAVALLLPNGEMVVGYGTFDVAFLAGIRVVDAAFSANLLLSANTLAS